MCVAVLSFFIGVGGFQVKLNQKRPANLARLASASVNLADLQSAHAQLVKQKDMVAVLCLLSAHSKLVEVQQASPGCGLWYYRVVLLLTSSAETEGRRGLGLGQLFILSGRFSRPRCGGD